MNLGFIGVGTIARDHAEAALALGHRIIAGCATSPESPRWQEFSSLVPDARFHANPRELLEDPAVDAAVACLPWNVTEEWLPKLLRTPKPVLIEKPVALSSTALAKVVRSPDVCLRNKIVGFNRRFYEGVGKLKERVDQGGLKFVEVTISETVAELSDLFGPIIIDHILVYSSSHALDTAVYLLGSLKPVRIYSHYESGYPREFRSFFGMAETVEGIPVQLTILADNPVPMGLRFYFDDRSTWHLSPLERLTAYKGYRREEPMPGSKIRRYTPEPFLEITENARYKPGFLAQMEEFTGNANRVNQGTIAATLAESAEILKFIEAIQTTSDTS